MADEPLGKKDWRVDTSEWEARQKVTEEQTTDWKGRPLKITNYADLTGMMAKILIETRFQDYLYPGPGRKITAENAPPGAQADYSPFNGNIRPPKASANALRTKEDGSQDFVKFGYSGSADEVFDVVFKTLHELTHARNPLARSEASWAQGAPSVDAVKLLVQAAVKTDAFPSQGRSGNIEELVASLSPVRDMNAAGIVGQKGTDLERVQKGYSSLEQQFPWLPNYLEVQSQPEKKFYSNSTKIEATPPSFTEVVTGALKNIFSTKAETK